MQENFVIAVENNDPSARVWDVDRFCDDGDSVIGEHLVTFDREKVSPVYNLFRDFPHSFSREQLEILREVRPFWWEFFSDRLWLVGTAIE